MSVRLGWPALLAAAPASRNPSESAGIVFSMFDSFKSDAAAAMLLVVGDRKRGHAQSLCNACSWKAAQSASRLALTSNGLIA